MENKNFDSFLPHDLKLILVDEVVFLKETESICKIKIPMLSSFLNLDDKISCMISVEIISQAAAISKSVWDRSGQAKFISKPQIGMVIKAKNFEFFCLSFDTSSVLMCKVIWSNTNLNLFNVKGEIYYDSNPEEILARGELLILCQDREVGI